MERKVKRRISLKTFFLKFLVQLMLSWILVVMLFAGILELLLLTRVMLPANAVESDIRAWLSEVDGSRSFPVGELPKEVDYACFSKSGELLAGNLSGEALKTARALAEEMESAPATDDGTGVEAEGASEASLESSDTLNGRSVYKTISGTEEILVLKYQVTAVFSSPSLRRLFPSVEPFLLVLFLLLFLADVVFFILYYARRLEKELSTLQYASEQIALQNLEFESEGSRIAEISRVRQSLLVLRDELKKSLREQWQLQQQKREQLSSLAHDIKTPLTIIKGNSELLAESELNAEQEEYNSYIIENTLQIQHYVTRILEISKEQSAASVVMPLTEILASVEKSGAALCLEKQLTFRLQKEHLPEVLLPEDAIKRILTNLLDNAVQYSPQGGTVTLTAACDTADIRSFANPGGSSDTVPAITFTVTDEGSGFTKAALLHGTEEFFCEDESRSGREHFGMGLAIVDRLVKELGGSLTLSNAPDGGAVVSVRLPVIL